MENYRSILLQQVLIVNKSLKLTSLSTLILGSVLFFQFYDTTPNLFLIIWSILWAISFVLRLVLLIKNEKQPPTEATAEYWKNLNFSNSLISSIMYSIGALSISFLEDQLSITIIFIVMAGICAGAVSSYGPLKRLGTIFTLPITATLIITSLLNADLNHAILALITGLFTFVVISTEKSLYTNFLNTVAQKLEIKELTEQKVRMEEKSKLRSNFFAAMSHEIRTPLNGITGLVDLMLKEETNKEKKDYLDTIKKSSDDLLNVINDVLDLSKIESEKLQLTPTSTNIRGLNKRMITLFSAKAEEKGIQLKLSEDNALPKNVLIDEHRLSQIISNLLSNAIKFTERGTVELNIQAIEKSRDTVKVKYQIIDNGIGIPKDKQAFVFKRYNQITLKNNLALTKSGTGLGLSIVKSLIDLMNGEIGVTSTEGSGSTFWFELDLPIIADQGEKLKAANKTTKPFSFKVLLVDDRDINLKVTTLMLKNLGCEVETAKNGALAIEQYNTDFDLVFMDLQMPVMDGATATLELQNKYGTALCPIICLSAQTRENIDESPEEVQFDYHLTKPLSLDVLKACLEKFV